MRINRAVYLILAVVFAAAASAADEKTKIKRVPVRATSGVTGAELYKEYCAVCHGATGKGGGPAARALKQAPTDLTAIARNNGGKYPEVKVQRAIDGSFDVAAHGSKDMPIWGPIMRRMSPNEDLGTVRIHNLVKYIESMQAR